MIDFWQKQTVEKPLFENLIWSRPENRRFAGKLLIIGGHTSGFSHVVSAYNEAIKAGAGVVRVLLPDSTSKILKSFSSDLEYAPSNSSGGFAKSALAEMASLAEWADGVLLAGDLGNNSETVSLLSSYLDKLSKPVCLINDALDYKEHLIGSPSSILVLNTESLQKLTKSISYPKPVTHSTSLVNLVEQLAEINNQIKVSLIVLHDNNLIVASEGNVSSVAYKEVKGWDNILGAHAITWVVQNPGRVFEALSCAVITAQK